MQPECQTAIMVASQMGRTDTVTLLLQNGVGTNAKDRVRGRILFDTNLLPDAGILTTHIAN